MAVDPYGLCPCGSGKKLKFCCTDLAGDIEKIHRMIEGDQPRAALRHVEQTLAAHPGRASLLDLKVIVELSLGELDAARKTADTFVAKHPESPTAHACRALVIADSDGNALEAVGALQSALRLLDREMPKRVFEALGAVGHALLIEGHIVAAQAHLWLNAAIAPQEETRARELLVGMNRLSGLPLLVRDQMRFRPWPENAPWKDEAVRASSFAGFGKWQQAVEIIDTLGQKYDVDPALVYNRALLGGWLGDDRALVGGLHFFAQMEGVPLDDAVEAEAVAQLLDFEHTEERYDAVRITFAVSDLDLALERLMSDRRVRSIDVLPETLTEDDELPPRNVFTFLDRPLPASGADISLADVPRLVGAIALYGRQTDRSERLVFTADKSPSFEANIAALREIAGDVVGEQVEEQVVGGISPSELALNLRLFFPHDTPFELRNRLAEAGRRNAIVERWPEIPRPELGGKSPREAAGSEELRIPLMASVLILEQGSNSDLYRTDIAELRSSLGLAQPSAIDGASAGVSELPLVRVPRLTMSSVSDNDLKLLYRRAILASARVAIQLLAQEVIRRPSLEGEISFQEAYRRLIATAADSTQALGFIEEARRYSEGYGQSTAPWDVAELELHISNGDSQGAHASLERIQQKFGHDQDVMSAVLRLLHAARAFSPEAALAPGVDDEFSTAPSGPASSPDDRRIWTPESDRPAGQKSALWTPS